MRVAVLVATAAAKVAAPCPVMETLDGMQCYGLKPDVASSSLALCRDSCCLDESCEVWQFNDGYGCFRGSSNQCMKSVDPFCDGSRGERLRAAERAGVVWFGSDWHNYAELVPVDPYSHGPHTEVLQTFEGEWLHFHRVGSGPDQLNVAASCWSYSRHPSWCCPGGSHETRACWPSVDIITHCCAQGQSADWTVLYNAFYSLTPHLTPQALQKWHKQFPGFAIDEGAYEATRQRFRVGHHPPGEICPSGAIQGTMDSSGVLWQIALVMAYSRSAASGTFLNIGAGTCQPPDPLHRLLASPEGQGLVGIAVDSNQSRLDVCRATMYQTPGQVMPVHMTVSPTRAAEQLLPYLALIFGDSPKPWPLDFLVVDLDGIDCLVIEELLQILRPKVIHMEIAPHIPPPFRFSLQWHATLSPHWDAMYDVELLNPFQGCSLSYALHKFRPVGYSLLRLTQHDAVLVHKSLAAIVEKGLRVKLPQDEFQCYRDSKLWLQVPASFVREWFFAEHPSAAIGSIWSNITAVHAELGRTGLPFTLDF